MKRNLSVIGFVDCALARCDICMPNTTGSMPRRFEGRW